MTGSVDPAVLDIARESGEIELTTFGRASGKPHRVVITITPHDSHLFIYSGKGMGRDWPQNLVANGRGVLHFDGLDVPFIARHLTDMAEARQVNIARHEKYGNVFQPDDENAVQPIETATFEAVPVPAFAPDVFQALAGADEVTLTTLGRKTGNPASVIIWITPVGNSLYIRSGGGIVRDWTQNLAANPEGALQVGELDLPVSVRYVTGFGESRLVSRACRTKYGDRVFIPEDETASPAETATFEVLPRQA